MPENNSNSVGTWQGLAWSMSIVIALGLGALLQVSGFVFPSSGSGLTVTERKQLDEEAKLSRELSDRVWNLQQHMVEIETAINDHFRRNGLRPIGTPVGSANELPEPEPIPQRKP